MPPYDFSELLREYQNRLGGSNLYQPAETPDGTSIANEYTQRGLEQNRQQAAQAQQQAILNPLERQIAQGLLGFKNAYAGAQNDQQRQAANVGANLLRQTAQNAGLDLSGYGEGVSLQDATQNLASNDARAMIDLMQGKYAMTSDQYYDKEYQNGIMLGLSHRRASKRAGNLAREYKAERISYLNGMINGYGLDGLVMTPMGNQMILSLAKEDPQSANFYAQTYPNAKEVYKRGNELEDKIIAQTNALEQLGLSHQYGQENMKLASDLEQDRMTYADILTRDKEQEYYLRNKADAMEADVNAQMREQQNYRLKMGRAYDMADFLKLEGDERNYFVAKTMGYPVPENKAGDSKIIQQAGKHLERLATQQKNVLEALKSEDLPDEQRQMLNAELTKITADINYLNGEFGATFGMQGKLTVPDYTGDEVTDVESLRTLLNYLAQNQGNLGAQLTEQGVFDAAREWVNGTDKGKKLSDEELKTLITKALSN